MASTFNDAVAIRSIGYRLKQQMALQLMFSFNSGSAVPRHSSIRPPYISRSSYAFQKQHGQFLKSTIFSAGCDTGKHKERFRAC
eukprot:429458-Pleurochrysis_carterae.AAC.4